MPHTINRNNSIYMIITCCVCGKQVLWNRFPSIDDKYCTKGEGSKAAFNSNEVFCGYCAVDLDENGLFPEERTDTI